MELIVDGWTGSCGVVMQCLGLRVLDDVALASTWVRIFSAASDLHRLISHLTSLKIRLPSMAQLLPPARGLQALALHYQHDTSGALARISAYQRALIVDLIRMYEFFAQEAPDSAACASYIARVVSLAVTDRTLLLAREPLDHTGLLHGLSKWARAIYPVSTFTFGSSHLVAPLP